MKPKTIEYLKSKNFVCLKSLGKGSFSEVLQVESSITKKIYAIKIISLKKSEQILIKQEIKILKQLSHPNIIQYFKAFFYGQNAFLVMQFIENGTIAQNLPQTEEQKHIFFKHLILAVQYLHQNNIIHCDLKLENILLEIPGDYTSIKIIDFGLSFQFEQNQQKFNYLKSISRQFGTPIYMAPELFNNAIYSQEIDIWSCGIILYMINFNGKHPFIEKNDKLADLKKKIKNGDIELDSDKCQEEKPFVYDLVKKMLKIEPEERLKSYLLFKIFQIYNKINTGTSLNNT